MGACSSNAAEVLRDNSGATAIAYSPIAAGIALAIIGAVQGAWNQGHLNIYDRPQPLN
jgi:Flp pilus assembly pilin Flp